MLKLLAEVAAGELDAALLRAPVLVEPKLRARFHSRQALVAAGLGCAIVPRDLSRLAGPEVVALPLADAAEAELWLVWHGERETPALAHFLALTGE